MERIVIWSCLVLLFSFTSVRSLPRAFREPDQFMKTLEQLHNTHRKAGKMNDINWQNNLDSRAQVRVEFQCGDAKAKPDKREKSFMMLKWASNGSKRTSGQYWEKDSMEKEFEKYYKESVAWFNYSDTKQKGCFSNATSNLNNTDDYHGQGQKMIFLQGAMGTSTTLFGCYSQVCSAVSNTSKEKDAMVVVCVYNITTKADYPMFQPNTFQHLCENDTGASWSSCNDALDKKCQAKGSGSNTNGSNTGGSNTGGPNTGGPKTLGLKTGGSTTGGPNTGGQNTGGIKTLGLKTGGSTTGGSTTGGVTSGKGVNPVSTGSKGGNPTGPAGNIPTGPNGGKPRPTTVGIVDLAKWTPPYYEEIAKLVKDLPSKPDSKASQVESTDKKAFALIVKCNNGLIFALVLLVAIIAA